MSIITVPHKTLRQIAQPVQSVDKKVVEVLDNLSTTLLAQKKPQGVGLAAPQINSSKRIFATLLPPENSSSDEKNVLRFFINPTIIDHSSDLTFGPNPDDPYLEGCLSIPELYGPVPRWEHISLSFFVIEHGQLIAQKETFSDFTARVIQHEFDHLDGKLFTDYSLRYDLPVYHSPYNSRKMELVDKRVLEGF